MLQHPTDHDIALRLLDPKSVSVLQSKPLEATSLTTQLKAHESSYWVIQPKAYSINL